MEAKALKKRPLQRQAVATFIAFIWLPPCPMDFPSFIPTTHISSKPPPRSASRLFGYLKLGQL